MTKYGRFSLPLLFVCAVIAGQVLHSCANKGYPEGGPKDVTPPKVIAEDPASFTKNFNKKSVNIYFDEYVQLKDIGNKFIVSPPMNKKPPVRLRGKYIIVEFQDSLRPSTTYSLDFADAIVDNNESNPLGFYRYVFSTGDVIDTLELSGQVVNAESKEPVLNAYVFLYSQLGDSVPLRQIPDYMARTDSSGYFRVTNLKGADYRVLAVMDDNRDYKYAPEAEQVAFLDTLVRPVVLSLTRMDTIRGDSVTGDSVVSVPYLAYGPNNLFLRMFKETPTQLYLATEQRLQPELLNFAFSIPGQNDFKIELLDMDPGDDWYLPEITAGKDTLNLWIRDSVVYKRDTLNFKLTYLRSDSTGQHVMYTDTTKLVFSKKKTGSSSKKNKKQEEVPVMEFLKIDVPMPKEQGLNKGIVLDFDKPVNEEDVAVIRLSEKVDSLYQPVKFEIHRDSLKLRRFYLNTVWKPGTEYMLEADSATIFDIYGRFNNRLERKFKTRSEESYGKLLLTLQGVEGQVIVQLYKPEAKKTDDGQKVFNILQERVTDRNGEIVFDFLDEGKYGLRVISDNNRNGKWDTGLYLKHIQPEEVIYMPGEITVKQNFDIEQEFDLKNTYKGKEQKKK